MSHIRISVVGALIHYRKFIIYLNKQRLNTILFERIDTLVLQFVQYMKTFNDAICPINNTIIGLFFLKRSSMQSFPSNIKWKRYFHH